MDDDEVKSARRMLQKKKVEKQLTIRQAYRHLFLNDNGKMKPDAMIVMRDLSRFCYASRSSIKINQKTGVIDPVATHVAEARREVFLRLINQLMVDDAIFNRLLTQYYDEGDL